MSFSEALTDATRAAGFFSSLGVEPGDRVTVMLSTSMEFIRVWTGLGILGAVAVLLNVQLRGSFLQHQLRSSSAEFLVVDSSLVGAVRDAMPDGHSFKRMVVVGDLPSTGLVGLATIAWSMRMEAKPFEGPFPTAKDIACIMFTSGTSGPAKGVLMPHAHCALYGVGAINALKLQADDSYYIALPLFHANGLLMQLGATLLAGIPAIIRPKFSASEWLGDIQLHRATVTNMLGALAAFILAQPPSGNERKHRLRAMLNAPNLPEHEAMFRERFGVRDVVSGFGMTEVNNPILGRLGSSCPGAAGWVVRDRFEVIIADSETDTPVPPGEIGEILVRPKVPFAFMAGYHEMPATTVEAWRNLWFHTGDAGTMDGNGLVTFVDRIKDCIRRRGENIAATEVEAAVAGLPGIAEVAAFAVPCDIPGGEDELMLAIVPSSAVSLSLANIGELAENVLPRFARPRFIELLNELPKTETGKVQRALLRKRGTVSAFDRDAAVAATRKS